MQKLDRTKYIGGSDVAAIILGQQYGRTRLDVWKEKAGLIVPANISNSPDIRRGLRQEPVARQVFVEETGLLVTPAKMVTHPEFPFIQGHPDGIFARRLLEIKCPRSHMYRRHKMAGVSQEYILQGVHYLACMPEMEGITFWMYSAEIDEGFRVDIDRADLEDVIEMTVNTENDFWESVQKGEEPDEEKIKQPKIPEFGKEDSYIKDDRESTRYAFEALKEATETEKAVKELKDEAGKKVQEIMAEQKVVVLDCELGRAYHREQKGKLKVDQKKLGAHLEKVNRFLEDSNAGELTFLIENFEERGEPFKTFKPYFV